MLWSQSQGDQEMACLDYLYGKLTAWIGLYKWYGDILSDKEFNNEWDEEEGAVKSGSGGQDSLISQMLMN